MCKIIVVANAKGGVGKTTISVNLASSLAVLEKKTLLIDMDPAAACSVSLGFQKDDFKGDIFSLLGFRKSLIKSIHKTNLSHLHFIPAYLDSYEAEEKIERLTYNMSLFGNILQSVVENYDYIIIDSPPYVRGMTAIALATASSVLIPVTSGHFALTAIKKLLTFVQHVRARWNHNLEIEGIIFSMYESRTRTWAITERKLYNSLGKYVLRTSIPKNSIISEATFFGKPVVLYDAKSKGAKAFLQLAKEIVLKNKVCPVIKLYDDSQINNYLFASDKNRVLTTNIHPTN
ncbi:ParA family protein [Bacteroidota bacterium]